MSFLISLLTALLPALADSLLKGINQAVNDEMTRRGLTQLGVETQVAADNAKAATVDSAIGKAEAQPVNTTTVGDRLGKGTF